MATWAIGDVQGCFETLRRLLARIGGPPPGDRIVLVGVAVDGKVIFSGRIPKAEEIRAALAAL
jgi:hypothetical protein